MFQRVFYKSKGFRSNVNVTAYFWGSQTFGRQEMTALELGDGVYSFELDLVPGKYAWLVFEDGVKITWNVLEIKDHDIIHCADCVYWIDATCRRKSPETWLINVVSEEKVSVWPPTSPTDACGEGVRQP